MDSVTLEQDTALFSTLNTVFIDGTGCIVNSECS